MIKMLKPEFHKKLDEVNKLLSSWEINEALDLLFIMLFCFSRHKPEMIHYICGSKSHYNNSDITHLLTYMLAGFTTCDPAIVDAKTILATMPDGRTFLIETSRVDRKKWNKGKKTADK